jgi:hypothetical protein
VLKLRRFNLCKVFYIKAISLTGASVASFIFIGNTKIFAPIGGSSFAFAIFSTRYLSALRIA